MYKQTTTFCTLDEPSCRREYMQQYVSRFLKQMTMDSSADIIVHVLEKSRVSFRHVFMAACIYRRCMKVYCLQLKDRPLSSCSSFVTRIKKDHPRVLMEDKVALFIVALVVGSKIIEDTVYSNQYWSELSLISHIRISCGERYVLSLLDWNIEPRQEEFAETVRMFEKAGENTIVFALKAQRCIAGRMREYLAVITQCVGWC